MADKDDKSSVDGGGHRGFKRGGGGVRRGDQFRGGSRGVTDDGVTDDGATDEVTDSCGAMNEGVMNVGCLMRGDSFDSRG